MVICHDKTPFVDYKCYNCGFISHVHKSQVEYFTSNNTELITTCQKCGILLNLPWPKPEQWVGSKEWKEKTGRKETHHEQPGFD